MKTPKKLLLVTSSYPDVASKEKSLVYPELVELVRAGLHVTLMSVRAVTACDPNLPPGVIVSDALSRRYQRIAFVRSLVCLFLRIEFWTEVFAHPSLLFRFRFWKDSLRAVISADVFRNLDGLYDLYYTYWFSGETTGMTFSGVSPVVSRAHGYDLYLERKENAGWIPYRASDLAKVSRVIVLSGRVGEYLKKTYQFDITRVDVFPLGVADRQAVVFNFTDLEREVLFLSCAYPAVVKRLPLIFQFVVRFAQTHSCKRIRWVHIGAHLRDIVGQGQFDSIPTNLIVDAKGQQSNEFVMRFMESELVAFFVNLSKMEGLPVSIMEAMAYGIPVVATDVGCTADLLEGGAGVLVSPDICVDELVDRVASVVCDPERYMHMRECAIRTQREKYCGEKNHQFLARRIVAWLDRETLI